MTERKATQLSTAARVVHARLREDILRGVIRAGEKLRTGELTTRYECGSIPLREALNRLAGEGLVMHSEQKGFTVAPVSLEDFADLTRARALVAEVAMRESVLHGDQAWEERVMIAHHRLKKISRYLNVATREPNPDYDRLHREFHSALLAGCRSKRLLDIADELFDHAERYRNLSRQVKAVPREDEHAQIVEAVMARDVEAAVRLVKRHIEYTYEIVVGSASAGMTELKAGQLKPA